MLRFACVILLACGGSTPVAESPEPEPEAETAETSETEPVAESAGMPRTQEVATALCEAGLLGASSSCAFRSESVALPGGAQADLMETVDDSGHAPGIQVLYALIRVPDNADATAAYQLAEAYDVPGESLSYHVDELTVSDGSLRFAFTVVTNTDDPEQPTERTEMLFQCTQYEQVWECERSEAP